MGGPASPRGKAECASSRLPRAPAVGAGNRRHMDGGGISWLAQIPCSGLLFPPRDRTLLFEQGPTDAQLMQQAEYEQVCKRRDGLAEEMMAMLRDKQKVCPPFPPTITPSGHWRLPSKGEHAWPMDSAIAMESVELWLRVFWENVHCFRTTGMRRPLKQ